MKRIRILVADDHALLRRGLITLLEEEKDFSVVCDVSNGQEALDMTARHEPDVIIMDLSMPVMDGVKATHEIHRRCPDAKILILTSFGSSADVIRAVEAGASGALVKDADDEELLAAIRTVASGGTVFSSEIKSMLNEPRPPELTNRQQEILKAIIRGLASDAIAAQMGITADTVNQHIDAIRKKLGAANRAEAVAIALRKRLLKI